MSGGVHPTGQADGGVVGTLRTPAWRPGRIYDYWLGGNGRFAATGIAARKC